ncbi:hypothetical protein ACFWP5_36535 [Streptomyces sp. NPDC058469]|uniref:Uncharacterized protein n=1 Tax=Streptomyces hokutonensis TaxID=1306990 RepID=A0ABW6M7P4_9ACTN
MELEAQLTTFSSPILALLTVLFAVALAHPEPQVRARAERILAAIFRVR